MEKLFALMLLACLWHGTGSARDFPDTPGRPAAGVCREADGDGDNLFLEEPEPYVPTVVQGMPYRQYRALYRPSEYVRAPGDRYLPALSGIASYFIPGLGQMICGEVGRGFAFLGATVGAALLPPVASALAYSSADASFLLSAGVCCFLAVYVWSIVDAVQVAKVKNMYRQDIRRMETQVGMRLYPSVNLFPSPSGERASYGVTLALTF